MQSVQQNISKNNPTIQSLEIEKFKSRGHVGSHVVQIKAIIINKPLTSKVKY